MGDPYSAPADSTVQGGGYRTVRGMRSRADGSRAHDGADLSNGRGGGAVRAAGNGLVVQVAGPGWNRGFGRHVVLAHRLVEGDLVYSVYAHLAPGSALPRRGQLVAAGEPIGRVGMTGRATSPHLHFEVRRPTDPHARWENAPPVDPLAFVASRLPPAAPDTSWHGAYLAWARCAALVAPDAGGASRPPRAEWWRALLMATRHALDAVPTAGDSLAASLVSLGLLPEGGRPDPRAPLQWSDLAGPLARAREQGLRLPWSPVPAARRRLDCRRELGIASPAGSPDSLGRGMDRGPTRADMCLVLADLAADPPPPRPRRKKPAAKAPAAAR